MLLAEEIKEYFAQFFSYLACTPLLGRGSSARGQHYRMIEGQQNHRGSQYAHNQHPGILIGCPAVLARIRIVLNQVTSHIYQTACCHNFGNIVEGALPSNISRLLFLVQFAHVNAIAGNVVGGTAKSDDSQKRNGNDKEIGQAQRECHSAKGNTRHELRCHYPKLLRAEEFKERTPKRFECVGQENEGGPEGD